MEIIYEWIRTIAVYLILVTVLLTLVNGKTYKKYVELVGGMVLILIVVSPITKLLSLDGKMQYNFNLSHFKLEMLEQEFFEKAETINQEALTKEYKKLLTKQVNQIVEQEGQLVEQLNIILSKEDYGVIEEIIVEIKNENKEETDKTKEINLLDNEIFVEEVFISIDKEKEDDITIRKEKNQVTEQICQKIATAFSIKEEQIIVYQLSNT